MKNLGKNFYINAIAALSALVGVILFFAANLVRGYNMNSWGWVAVVDIISMLLLGACAYMSAKKIDGIIVKAMYLVAIIPLVITFGSIVLNRAELAAGLFTFDSNNALGWSVLILSIVNIAFVVITEVLVTIGAFAKQIEE